MSDRTHKQQLERARARREADRLARRQQRSKIIVIVMVALLALSLGGVGLIAGLVGDDDSVPPQGETSTGTSAAPDQDATTDPPLEATAGDPDACPSGVGAPASSASAYDEPPRTELDPDATYTATIVTTCGDVVVELASADAPRTVENFVSLAEDGYYAGSPFHRTIADFMIQGGDPTGTGTGGPGYAIDDELDPLSDLDEGEQGGVVYTRGVVAMANSGPDSAGSQFFVVQADPGYELPAAYTILGTVVDGLDVVDAIAAGEVAGDRAIDPTVITEVSITTS